MRIPSHPTLIRRLLDSRLKMVAAQGPLLSASLALVHKRCGQPSCSCHTGGPLHPAAHLTYKDHGKTRTVYVPKDLLPQVQSWVAEHKRLKQLIAQINQLTLALVRGHAQDRRRKKGRP